MKSIYLILMAGAVLLCASCKKTEPVTEKVIDTETEKEMIGKVIYNSIGWALTKDTVALYESLSGSNLFIFHPDSGSTVTDISQIRETADRIWLDDRFKATGLDIRELRIELSPGGDVAWYSCFLDDLGEWDSQPIGWYNARWTGVLVKRDGKWVIVQMHFSFAA
jgi:hypothetical protein